MKSLSDSPISLEPPIPATVLLVRIVCHASARRMTHEVNRVPCVSQKQGRIGQAKSGMTMRPRQYQIPMLLAALVSFTVGCQRLMNQDAAIQKAIQQHLTERSDLAMDKMVMEMQKVTVDGDKAQAEVVFRVAGGGDMPESRMGYHYDLHREGGAWKVDSGR